MRQEGLTAIQEVLSAAGLGGISVKATLANGEAHFIAVESEPPLPPEAILNALYNANMLFESNRTGRRQAAVLIEPRVYLPGSITFADMDTGRR